jgi:hypothetical protein
MESHRQPNMSQSINHCSESGERVLCHAKHYKMLADVDCLIRFVPGDPLSPHSSCPATIPPMFHYCILSPQGEQSSTHSCGLVL